MYPLVPTPSPYYYHYYYYYYYYYLLLPPPPPPSHRLLLPSLVRPNGIPPPVSWNGDYHNSPPVQNKSWRLTSDSPPTLLLLLILPPPPPLT